METLSHNSGDGLASYVYLVLPANVGFTSRAFAILNMLSSKPILKNRAAYPRAQPGLVRAVLGGFQS